MKSGWKESAARPVAATGPVRVIALALVCCLSPLVCLAPQAARAQSQSQSMKIIAGVSVPQEGVACGEICVGTSTLGYILNGCRSIPYSLPASPIPICNTGYGGDGGPAVVGMLNVPIAVAADAQGNVYVADAGNRVVREIDRSGNISTYACVDATSGAVSYSGCQLPPPGYYTTSEGYPPVGAYPTGVAVNSYGQVEVAVAFAGTGQGGDLAMTSDSFGNVYRLNMGSGGGFDFTIFRNGYVLLSTQGGTLPFDTYFTGLAADSSGNLYTIESGGNIVKINLSGTLSTVVSAPQLGLPYPTNGLPGNPLAIDSNGNLYVLTNFGTYGGATVSEYNVTSQQWTTIAGTGTNGFNNGNDPNDLEGLVDEFTEQLENPASSPIDAPMPATSTDLNNANGIAIGPDGALYIADTGSNVVRKIGGNPAGVGCQECGPTTLAITDQITRPVPSSWALNPSLHKLYTVTSSNPGVVTVFNTTNDTVADNIQFGPTSVISQLAVDSTNNLVYVTDTVNNVVYVVNGNTDQQASGSPVTLPGMPVNIAVLPDTGNSRAYITIQDGGYSVPSPSLPAVAVVAGSSTSSGATYLTGLGAHSGATPLPGASAIIADTLRDKVYVRFFGTEGSETFYSLGVIDATNNGDTVSSVQSLAYATFQTNVYPDSMAVDESTGDVLIGDDYDQFVHLWEYADQTLSGIIGGYEGFYTYHVAADSINGIFYTWDGYGNVGYLVPNQSSGTITSTSVYANSNATSVAVDSSTEQAYIVNCNTSNSDGTLGTLTLWDGSTDSVTATQPLEIPSAATSEACGGILVDTSNPSPATHSAWLDFLYNSSPSGLNITTGQIDVINGPTPAARPTVTISPNPISFGAVGINQISESQLLQITNTGQAPLTSPTVVIQNLADPGSIQIGDCSGGPLAPGSSCTVPVTFTPTQLENLSASIQFLDNAPDTPQTLAITGSGVPTTGALTITPQSLPPGTVNAAYNQKLAASGSTLNEVIFTLGSGTLPPGLTLYPYGQISGTPSQTGTFNFTVNAADPNSTRTGSQFYSLTITSDLGEQAVADVFGTGSFGAIEFEEPSATQQIQITDDYSSAAALQITGITLTGPNAGDFTESDNCEIAAQQLWQPGQGCTINVTFLPTVAPTANETAELVVGANASIAPIFLTGTSAPGLGAPASLPVAVSVDNGNPPNLAQQGFSGSFLSSGSSSVSSGGQFVAFSIGATNLPGPPLALSGSPVNSIYLRNTCEDTSAGCEESTNYISYGPTTGPGSNGGAACNNTTAGGYAGSTYPAIDATGEFVAFTSDMCGFTGSASGSANQIFLRDVLHGNTSLISTDASGQPFGSGVDHASFSMNSNARFFAFQTTSSNVVSGASNSNSTDEVYWRDACTGQSSGCNSSTILVSQDGKGNAANNTAEQPTISANGRYVAYASHATNIASNPTDNNATGVEQVYLYDTCTGAAQGCNPQTTLISVDAKGNAVGGTNPSVSGDGRFVAFVSSAPTLVSATSPPTFIDPQIFVADTCYSNGVQVANCGASITLRSAAGGNPGNGPSSSPFVSADGRLITFRSQASNLNSSGSFAEAIYKYDTCQANGVAITPCTAGIGLISVDANDNLLTQGSDGAVVDATDQYFSFVSNVPSNSGYPAAEVYLGPIGAPPPPAPTATFIPTAINFGSVNVGQGLQNGQILTLVNTGNGPLQLPLLSVINTGNTQTVGSAPFGINSIYCNTSPGGPVSTQEAVSALPNLTLAPGIACAFILTMQPTDQGTYSGTINFDDNAAQSNVASSPTTPGYYSQTISLTGTTPPAADLSISVNSTAALATTGLNLAFDSLVVNRGLENATNVTVTYTFNSAVQFESFTVTGSGSTPNACTPPAVGTIITTFTCDLGSLVHNGGFAGSFSPTITVAPITGGPLTLSGLVSGDQFDPDLANNSATSAAVTIALATTVNVNDPETIHVADQEGVNQSISGLVAYVGDPETINVEDQEGVNRSISGLVAYVGDPETINVKDMESPTAPSLIPVVIIGSKVYSLILDPTDGVQQYIAIISLSNGGNIGSNLQVTSATLNGAGSTSVPISLSLGTSGSANVTLNFPSTAGASGKVVILSVKGTYSAPEAGGGSLNGSWTGNFRVTLPANSN